MADGPETFRPEAGLRLVRAPNPSPMTYSGTNTWIVGEGEVAVIDPGPAMPEHLSAIMSTLDRAERVTAILVTHAHRDHAPLSRTLGARTGARIYAAGFWAERRRPIMAQLAQGGGLGGGEGIDETFRPDMVLEDGMRIVGDSWTLEAIATPGHTADHMAFAWGDRLFTGDHVMGWASSLVSPPDGDLVSFMASCPRVKKQAARVSYPGHGAPVEDPEARLDWLIAHRNTRTAQILEALREGPATAHALAKRIYTDTDPRLLAAAERNVLAHLIALIEDGSAAALGALRSTSEFVLRE